MRRTAFLLIILMAAGCATPAPQQPQQPQQPQMTQHHEGSLFQKTDQGLYSVEMLVPDNMLKTGRNSMDIIVHNAMDRDIEGARIMVEPWMPMKEHGSPEKANVTEVGRGRYTISNVLVPEKGHWQLRLTVEAGSGTDTSVFDFPGMMGISKMHTHQAMDMASAQEKLVTVTEKDSEKAFFKVSYESETTPIPLNRIHSWKVRVAHGDDIPVSVAVITVDGGMPEHGHGLPTKPQVTENLGGGYFLVEGMKFQMPGWWEVKFLIKTGQKEDTVVFNLVLK